MAGTHVDLVTVSASEVQLYREAPNLRFKLTGAVVRLLPMGKVTAGKALGRSIFRGSRGVVRTSSGLAIAVDVSNIDFGAELIKYHGLWDRHVSDTCLRFLEPGGVFYDIGANSGYVALEVAAHARGGATVIAFEPQPLLARKIAISNELNGLGNVDVYAAMVGREDDETMLFLASDSIHASAIARREHAAAILCPVVRLDTLVSRGALPIPNLIKIDVEGGERDVLIGADNTIKTHHPVIVFEADNNCERFGYSRNDLLDHFNRFDGYRLFFIDLDGRLIARDDDPNNCNTNLAAIYERSEPKARTNT